MLNNLREVLYTSSIYETYIDTRNYLKRHKLFITIILIIDFFIIISLVPVFHNLMCNNNTIHFENENTDENIYAQPSNVEQYIDQPSTESTPKQTTEFTGVVNINTATINELCQLPCISTEIANNIIEYRNNAGYFDRIIDIQNVKGIGPDTFNKIKKFIKI